MLLLLCAFLFFYRLADRDLWSSHEGRAAQNAQSVVDSGSWGVPRLFDKRLELQKPPLYYWLVAAIGEVQGGEVDAWAVRLPAALSGLLAVFGVYFFAWKLGRPIAGLVAACVLACAVHFTTLARTGRIDMPLTLAVGVAIVSYYLGHLCRRDASRHGAWKWWFLGYTAIAIALLLKGPIGFALPAAVIALHLLVEREIPAPWRWRAWIRLGTRLGVWWGIPLVLALVLPWYVWANLETDGAFFQSFFWYHNVERAIGGDDNMHARPWYLYAVYLATHFAPWSVLFPFAIWYGCRHRKDGIARLGLLWMVGILALLSFARFKRADYLLPMFPGAALLIGCAAEAWFRMSHNPRRVVVAFGSTVALCVVGWFVYLQWILPGYEPSREYQRFAHEIRQIVPAPRLILFFRTEEHALAFHLGPELDTFLEWENLDIWAGRPGCHYIVMPAECAERWSEHVTSGRLEEVLRCSDFGNAQPRKRPVVLMRTEPHP